MNAKLITYLILNFSFFLDAYAGSATWSMSPTSNSWNTAANWTPPTVPNGPSDVATFGVSNQTNVFVVENVEVDQIVFNTGASAFTITSAARPSPFAHLNFTGTGVINNSGVNQTFVTQVLAGVLGVGVIAFYNSATAGSSTTFINSSSPSMGSPGGATEFFNSSTAGDATIINEGASVVGGGPGGYLYFYDSSSAGNSLIIHHGGTVPETGGGEIWFNNSSTADHATVISTGGEADSTGAGTIYFVSGSTAGSANFTLNGGAGTAAAGGSVLFYDHSSAGNGLFTMNGGSAAGAYGGSVNFYDGGANEATLIANGGTNGGMGGTIFLDGQFHGGRTKIEVFDDGAVDISGHHTPGVTIGSLTGDGLVYLGALTLTVGGDNLDSTFSGTMQDGGSNSGTGGSFAKIGTGKLTLDGASNYTGGTTLSAGSLVIDNTTGSGTGTGAMNVNAGTLGGKGTVAGAVTVGTGSGAGAFLQPSIGVIKTTSLSIQSALTLKTDSTYTYKLNTSRVKADKVIANGVTIDSGAQFNFVAAGNNTLSPGKVFVAISNTAATPITGTFANLPDGSTFIVGSNTFQVSYEGGDGNDLSLTVVP